MKKVLISAALVVSVLFSACTSGKAEIRQERYENPDYTEFIKSSQDYLEHGGFQGSVLVSLGDEIVYADGFGYSDILTETAATALDTYELGSISKQMTAAAILQLQEKGLLSVEDTLDNFFPEYPFGGEITLDNLLRMKSGLYDYISDYNIFFGDFAEEYLRRADSDNDDTPDFERDFLLEYLYSVPLRDKPGTEYYYCNTNYYLLGLIIEQKSGLSYQDYLQKFIFEPCGMTTANNGFRETTARGSYPDGSTLSMRTSTALGCGSVNGSVYDVFKWYQGLMSGKVISAESLELMTTPTQGNTYCYGIFCPADILYHGGNTDVFNSFAIYYKSDGFLAVALCNKPIHETSTTYVGKNLRDIYKGL